MEPTEKPVKKTTAKKVAAPAPKVESDKPTIKRRLEDGDSGPAVLWAQKRLYEMGYLAKEPNGRYGTLMSKAVRKWQEANGLKLTGVLNEHDWSLL